MATKVYFLPVQNKQDPSSVAKGLKSLSAQSGVGNQFERGDFIGVKTHFGERGNTTFIPPLFVKVILDRLKLKGVKPFLTETSTLYRGNRSNAIDHFVLANEHGFGFERMNVPLIMADGLFGDSEIGIQINGKHFETVNIASEIVKMQGMVILSHLTGHMQAGVGGAIKNIGMGLSSRRGKLKQHSVMSPEINPNKCTACEVCIQWCPQDTISLEDGKAYIHKENCIGCGECLAVCKFDAVLFDWGRDSNTIQEMMSEHTAGVVKALKGRVFYFNFCINITQNCDCMNGGSTVSPDIGILAGEDLVAVEQASYDKFQEVNRKSIQEGTFPRVNPLVQVRYAERLGLGSQDYELVTVK